MWRILLCGLAAASAAPLMAHTALPTPPVHASEAADETLEARAQDALAVLQGNREAEEVFAPAFLQQVSPAQLQAITRQITNAYGAPLAVEEVTPTSAFAGTIAIRFEKAIGRGSIAIDPEAPHLVTGLLLQTFEAVDDSAAKIEAELQALPGEVNAWFGPLNGSAPPLLALNAQEPLALGSTFKLYVLAALSRAINAGEHRWDEVVPLSVRSYPSGVVQDWPQGSPVTLQTLATLMLQVSDNTATDQIIALLGRDRIETELRRTNPDAARSMPFLSTRELFMVKADPQLRQRYAAANETERRQILATLPKENAPLAQVSAAFGGNPIAIDSIEWFASPEALRRLGQELAKPEHATARRLMSANRNLGDEAAAKWAYVGYKGGSEPGVLNLTWLLQDKQDRWHLLTVGWNNPNAPVDTMTLDALAKRLLALAPA